MAKGLFLFFSTKEFVEPQNRFIKGPNRAKYIVYEGKIKALSSVSKSTREFF